MFGCSAVCLEVWEMHSRPDQTGRQAGRQPLDCVALSWSPTGGVGLQTERCVDLGMPHRTPEGVVQLTRVFQNQVLTLLPFQLLLLDDHPEAPDVLNTWNTTGGGFNTLRPSLRSVDRHLRKSILKQNYEDHLELFETFLNQRSHTQSALINRVINGTLYLYKTQSFLDSSRMQSETSIGG